MDLLIGKDYRIPILPPIQLVNSIYLNSKSLCAGRDDVVVTPVPIPNTEVKRYSA